MAGQAAGPGSRGAEEGHPWLRRPGCLHATLLQKGEAVAVIAKGLFSYLGPGADSDAHGKCVQSLAFGG